MTRLGCLLIFALACAPRVARPPSGLHIGEEPAIVPYPPPAAQVELLPPQPSHGSVWIDGHWDWTGAGFAWQRGRWDVPPAPGAYYAPATSVRSPNGQLFYYTGRWHLPDGRPVASRSEP